MSNEIINRDNKSVTTFNFLRQYKSGQAFV